MEVLRDKAADTAAWGEFVRIYGPPVVAWCRERGLQHDDALDVTQDVLLRFWKASKQFDYDSRGRFRSYLEQVARSALVSWAEKAEAAHDQATRSLLEKIPDREGLLARLGVAGPAARRLAQCDRKYPRSEIVRKFRAAGPGRAGVHFVRGGRKFLP
jgi:RNA polymerase sigma factor (sigma-70 family)